MDEADVLETIAYAEGTWRTEIPDGSKIVWTKQLADLDVDVVRRAIDDVAADERFAPTPQRVRARALELAADVPGFSEAWDELCANASTCDWFDPSPPTSMSLPAQALARSLDWTAFRAAEISTYYVHEARQRFAEISDRAARRMREGLPAFEQPEPKELPGDVLDLVRGLGAEEPLSEMPEPSFDISDATRAKHRAKREPRGQEQWTEEAVEAAKALGRERLEKAIGEELAEQERARARVGADGIGL